MVIFSFATNTTQTIPAGKFDGILLAVAHDDFITMDFSQLQKEKSVVYDVKSVLDKKMVDGRL